MSSAPDLGDDVVDALSTALNRAQGDLDALAEAAAALSADPTGPLPDFGTLARRRDASLLGVGRALTRAVSQGFQLVLEDPPRAEAAVKLVETAVDEPTPAGPPQAPPPEDSSPPPEAVTEEATAGLAPDEPAQATPEEHKPPSAPAVPATEDSLQRLSDSMGDPHWEERTPKHPAVAPLARAWGAPDAAVDVAALLTASKGLDSWLTQPRAVQTKLLAYATVRCRDAQEQAAPRDADALVTVFRRLSGWSKSHQPGYVYGLARKHTPDRDSWRADAQAAWLALGMASLTPRPPSAGLGDLIALLDGQKKDGEAIRSLTLRLLDHSAIDQRHLDQVLEPHLSLLKGDKRFKRIKKRIKKRLPKASPKAEPTPLEVEWPGLTHTQGKRALMVGGDYRHQTQQKLQDALGFSEVHWDTGWEPRRTASCAERIRSGRYDLVLLVRRFLKHRTTDVIVPACKDEGIPLVPVPSGYGLRVVKKAIEDHMGVDETPEEG